jgi:hypothetical protein
LRQRDGDKLEGKFEVDGVGSLEEVDRDAHDDCHDVEGAAGGQGRVEKALRLSTHLKTA